VMVVLRDRVYSSLLVWCWGSFDGGRVEGEVAVEERREILVDLHGCCVVAVMVSLSSGDVSIMP
jgi:hypothetical protein